jgi:hypothetical protein
MTGLHPAPVPTNVRALRQALETYDDDADVRLEYTTGAGIFEKGLPLIVIYLDDPRAEFATIWDGAGQPRSASEVKLEPITEHETRDDDDAMATQLFVALAVEERARQIAIGYDTAHDLAHPEEHLMRQAARLHAEGRHAAAYAMILAAADAYPHRFTTEEPTA